MSLRVLVLYREAAEVPPYGEALVAAGLSPELVPADRLPPLRDFQGLLLSGGNDVDPARYGEIRQPETEEPDRGRDDLEFALLRQALAEDLPILAICRGLQLLNVFHGGSLVQHLANQERHNRTGSDRLLPAHRVRIEPDSLLGEIAGRREWVVNSRHHQAVRGVGTGLRVSAVDPHDGTVEALERPDRRFVLGCQWHPENQAINEPEQLKIFERFRESMR